MVCRSGRGCLIAFEGIDGAGKTSQARMLVETLRGAGVDAIYTREPTDGPWGRRIRESAESGRLAPEEELQAFLEDRKEHVRDLIRPALARGAVVVVDRYYFSSVAYQGARGIDPARILRENEAIAPAPDLVFLLGVDSAEGMRRVRDRGQANLFEREDFLAQAGMIFDRMEAPGLHRIDGALPAPVVTETILRHVLPLLGIDPKLPHGVLPA